MKAAPSDDDYPRLPLRRRLLLVLLAVATALTIAWMLIYRPGDAKRGLPRAAAASAPAVPASGVGGKAEVLLLPAPAAASARP